MKVLSAFLLSVLTVVFFGCSKQQDHHHEATSGQAAPEEQDSLYKEVMKLHDEGMARMDEILRLKQQLADQISAAPDLVEAKKQALERKILALDSASKGMMAWMRAFRPEVDSLSSEQYHDYLESEREKVKKVRDDIMEAIGRAKED